MTYHAKDFKEAELDPAFGENKNAVPDAHHANNTSRSEDRSNVAFTISLSPKKIFLAGFALSILVMSIPFAYFVVTASSQGPNELAAAAVLDQGAAPSDPSSFPPQPSAPSGPVKPVSKDDHIRGSGDATLSIIEYSDFECPFCKRFHPTVQQALQEYDGKVNWVYRHFPLSFHVNAAKEAEASECANELGGNKKFWEYTDKIFERTTSNGTGFALDALIPLAKELGLNEKKFQECLDSGKYVAHVQQDFSEGQAAGIDGTPGNILLTKDGKEARVPGAVPYEQLKAEIDRILTK